MKKAVYRVEESGPVPRLNEVAAGFMSDLGSLAQAEATQKVLNKLVDDRLIAYGVIDNCDRILDPAQQAMVDAASLAASRAASRVADVPAVVVRTGGPGVGTVLFVGALLVAGTVVIGHAIARAEEDWK